MQKLNILINMLLLGFALLIINEILIIIFKLKRKKLIRIPNKKFIKKGSIKDHNCNTNVSSHNSAIWSSSSIYDDYNNYNEKCSGAFNTKEKFNNYTAEKVGRDYSGNYVYHDKVTGSYTTVNYSGEVEEKTYYRPSMLSSDDDYYNNSQSYYDDYYKNDNDDYYNTIYGGSNIYSDDD